MAKNIDLFERPEQKVPLEGRFVPRSLAEAAVGENGRSFLRFN